MARLVEKVVDGRRILGFSLAGEETVIIAPDYNVCFDIGRAPREAISIDNVCLTHGHMDHAAGIAYYFSQRAFVGNSPGRVIVHRSLAQSIQKLMDIWGDIEGHPSPGFVQGVEALEDVNLRRDMLIRPFSVNHTQGALGFTLIEVRHKLKAEFHGKTGPQLVELKRQGVKIEERLECPLITFSGDTAVGRWMQHDFVKTSAIVLLECTFYEKDHLTRASAGRHIHVKDLPEILKAIPEARIVLTHVTRRTDLITAKRILEKTISPSDLKRTEFLMERPPRPPRRRSEQRPTNSLHETLSAPDANSDKPN